MIPRVLTQRYVACPREGCDGKFMVDHLLKDWRGRSFGPWYCEEDHCDVVMSGRVTEGADLDVTFGKREHKRGLALLKLGDALLIYPEHRLSDRTDIKTYDYFFHSHQCPINLLRHAVDVFIGGHDVHGQVRYVASVEDTPEVRKKLETVDDLSDLLALFQTDGSLPPTHWPPGDQGLVPWLAELRRLTAQRGDLS